MKRGLHLTRRRAANTRWRRLRLYRAVCAAELADIQTHRAFRCPTGYEVKYFALSRAGAEKYAALAGIAFGEGPFTILRSSVRKRLIEDRMLVEVDQGIATVVLPKHLLPSLKSPKIVGRFPPHG